MSQSAIAWQCFIEIPKHERSEGGPKERQSGEPFFAEDAQRAAVYGRRLVGRQFTRVQSLASLKAKP